MSRGVNDNRGPSGRVISWSVRTLTNVIIRGMDLLDGLAPHAVKIIRYLANAAREKFLEAVNNKLKLEELCVDKDCAKEMDVNYNDRIQLIALMNFAVYGVDRAIQQKSRLIEASFNNFYKINIRYIKDRVEKFSVDPKI